MTAAVFAVCLIDWINGRLRRRKLFATFRALQVLYIQIYLFASYLVGFFPFDEFRISLSFAVQTYILHKISRHGSISPLSAL
jgi:hypothetical protein